MIRKIRLWSRYRYPKLSRGSEIFLEQIQMTEFIYMILIAVFIGVVAGFGSIDVKYLIETISDWAFYGEGTLIERVKATPWYMILLKD